MYNHAALLAHAAQYVSDDAYQSIRALGKNSSKRWKALSEESPLFAETVRESYAHRNDDKVSA